MRSSLLHLLVGLLTGAVGCSASERVQNAKDRVKRLHQLKMIAVNYREYCDNNPGKAPQKPEDLITANLNSEAAARLKSGEIVFLYGVSLTDIRRADKATGDTIVAYEKDVPQKGGVAMYADGAVKNITADEFKKAILAKKQ